MVGRIVLFAFFLLTAAGPALSAQPARAAETVDLVLFYGQGCPHCAAMRVFMEKEKTAYPQLRLREYEVYFDNDNALLFQEVADAYGIAIEGVPTAFIGDHVVVGYSEEVASEIDRMIRGCIDKACPSPLTRVGDDAGPPPTLTFTAVALAAAVDAINPCAFAVLILLMTAVLAAGDRRRALRAGLAFSLSIFISYYLMGIGLYSAVAAAGFTQALYIGVGVLAIVMGLFNLKDFLWYGKWFVTEVPRAWRPTLKRLMAGVTSAPGAFLIGFAISLFLLPCTSGPYVVILGLLAKTTTRAEALSWLLLYNAIFVLPMIAITGAIYFGLTTTARAEDWRTRHLRLLHLVAGLVLLTLGIGMLAALWLGKI